MTFPPFPPRAGLVRNDLLTGYRDVREESERGGAPIHDRSQFTDVIVRI